MTRMPLLGLAVLVAATASTAIADGDRHPPEHRVFPRAAFFDSGSGCQLLDVTKPPFCAKGDGVTDDTVALSRAMAFIREKNPLYVRTNGCVYCCQSHKANWAIYLPRGTYRITDTVSQGWPAVGLNNNLGWDDIRPILVLDRLQDVRLSELERNTGVPESYFAEANWAIRLIGEDREGTVIRLDDGARGFGTGARKPLLSFCLLMKGSNVNLGNFLENITLDAGKGNPGAVGVRWNSSNYGGLRNVTIRAGDGDLGLDMGYRNACGYIRDVTIDGFRTGLDLSAGSETTVVMEHSTIRNAAFAFSHHDSYHGVFDLLNLRRVSLEDVGQVLLNAKGFRVTVKDCPFAEDSRAGLVVAKDVPSETYPGLSEIATPEEFGARGDGIADDTDAIQMAFGCGRRAVYFLHSAYRITKPIVVPLSVDCVDGMHAYFRSEFKDRRAVFRVEGDSSSVLEIRRIYFGGGILIDHVGSRILSVTDVFTEFPPGRGVASGAPSWYTYRNATPRLRKQVFITDCVQFCPEVTPESGEALENVDLQARSVNNETSKTASIALRDSQALLFGVKSENCHTCLDLERSTVDVYGMTYLQWAKKDHWNHPIIVSRHSNCLIDGYLWRHEPMQPIVCREVKHDGSVRVWKKEDFVRQVGEDGIEIHLQLSAER